MVRKWFGEADDAVATLDTFSYPGDRLPQPTFDNGTVAELRHCFERQDSPADLRRGNVSGCFALQAQHFGVVSGLLGGGALEQGRARGGYSHQGSRLSLLPRALNIMMLLPPPATTWAAGRPFSRIA